MANPTVPNIDTAQVTLEDQQKINKFARKNMQLVDLQEEIQAKKKELQNLEDAETDLMMLEDDDELIPYQIGEVFVHQSSEDTQSLLECLKEGLTQKIQGLESQSQKIKSILSELKVQLYAKFGTNINLETDD